MAVVQVIPLLRKCSLAGHAEFKTQDEVRPHNAPRDQHRRLARVFGTLGPL